MDIYLKSVGYTQWLSFTQCKLTVNCQAYSDYQCTQLRLLIYEANKMALWLKISKNLIPFQSLSGHTTPVECVCFGHSEDLVCAGSQTGALKIWDLEAAKLLRTFTGHKGAIKCMDFHPYGDYLTTGSCDSNIKLWDTRKRGCIVTYSSHRLAVNSLQFSPDGQWIASACEDGKFLIIFKKKY